MDERRNLRPKSRRAYRYAFGCLQDELPADLQIGRVTGVQVQPVVEDSGVSAATRAFRYRHLKAFFNWAVA
jgi:hypothetical protein